MAGNYDLLFAACVTPFKPDMEEVDEAALRSFMRYFMQPKFINVGGGIIINPEAGEVVYLSRDEARRNVQIALEECGGKVPVFAGVLAPALRDTLAMARDAKAEGVDGIFFMPPLGVNDITSSWNPERYPDVWIDMAQAIEDAVDLPMVVHPVSGVMHPIFGMGLPLLAARKMWEQIPHVVGWKMTYSYEGYRIIAKALQEFPRHIAVLGAGATRFHENLAMRQLDGTVTGSHNFSMELIVDHLQAWQACNLEQACQIWFDGGLCSLQEYVYSDGSRLHVRYKAACWLRGLIPEPFMRRPMPKPMVEEVHELRTLLRGAGYEVISDSAVKRLYPDIW